MSTASWKADPRAVAEAEAELASAASAVSASPIDTTSLARLLHAAGRLVVLETTASLPETLAPLLPSGAAGRAALLAVLDREALREALEESAVRLRELLERAEGDGDEPTAPRRLGEDTAALLAVRDDAETELLGAAFALECSPESIEASSPSRWVFDEVLRPESWRLVTLNRLRQAVLAKLSPRLQARFWWWNDGAALPEDSVAALAAAAQLVARFPRARARFEALVHAETAWTSQEPARPEVVAPVRTLRAWLADRSSSELALAAAGAGDEQLVFETSELQISFATPSRLLVDLLADRRHGALPVLRASTGETLVASAVSNATERFTFELGASMLDDARVVLVVPFDGEDRELVLAERERP